MKKPKIHFTNPESRKVGPLMTEERRIEEVKKWVEEDIDKLDELCEFYKVEAGDAKYLSLALELARQFLPERKKRGAKTKWNEVSGCALAVELERLIEGGATQMKAAKMLAKEEPWVSFIESKDSYDRSSDPAKALLEQYKKYRNDKMMKVMRDAFSYRKYIDDIDSWDKFVMGVTKPIEE
ncbi:hypothetical protein [Solemya elarraichensis gill symbiont]|uniref:Uncharacterized protein n=1 Tax=Solemya elarraichensis gill symbiont TaxID=1918949 RepID=A0A1T2L547_9GAMM|nr:hypothetical protein [Solemya elarraichensis gill symbiont]OOZ40237.1 hypothetical protein BOW52_06145 [Solemya elarraichensis gill symbiont]